MDVYNIGVRHGHETGGLPTIIAVGRRWGYPLGGVVAYKNGVIERFDVKGVTGPVNISDIGYWFRQNPTKEQIKKDERPVLQYVAA